MPSVAQLESLEAMQIVLPSPNSRRTYVLSTLAGTLALGIFSLLIFNKQISTLTPMLYFNTHTPCNTSGATFSECDALCRYYFFPLERQKLRSLIMVTLAVFAQLRENGIEFVPNGGTFIGSVRHAGIIPWDKDVDIWFLMNDTNLKKLQPNGIVHNALVARGFKVRELRETNEFWVYTDYAYGKHVYVEFIPYCIRGDTVVIRCTLSHQKRMSRATFYPLIWIPFHTGFVSIPKKREKFWDEAVGLDSRESTMDGASFQKMMDWVAPTDHSSTVLVPISEIKYLKYYDPKDWDRTLPIDCSDI